jgi:hypothetical protein
MEQTHDANDDNVCDTPYMSRSLSCSNRVTFFYRMFTQPNLCVYTTTHDIARYPVLRNAVSFGGRSANKEDWNRFVMALKTSGSEDLQDVMKFLAAWCGATESSGSYSF